MNYFKIKADAYSMKKAKRLSPINNNSNLYETDTFQESYEVEDYLKKLKIVYTGVSKMQLKK
jgi:hypothetical protein